MSVNPARLALLACCMPVLGGCPQEAAPDRPVARLEGQVQGPGVLQGDAYLFLFAPGEGPPQGPATPRYVTAVSELRLGAGDSRYRFAEVAPGTYSLWGFVDANGDVELFVEVLAQPGAGDWLPEAPVAVELAAGQTEEQVLEVSRRRLHGPPAFRVTGEGTDGGIVTVPASPQSLVSLSVEADDLGLLLGEEPRFFVRLLDVDGDGSADDLNGDGLPDLFPQFFLRFVPRPGQALPQGATQVIVPLVINPAPLLPLLQGDVTRELSVASLQLFVVPVAQAVSEGADGGQVLTSLAAIPLGEYQLWALSAEGAFWYVPNALGERDAPRLSSQALRFEIR